MVCGLNIKSCKLYNNLCLKGHVKIGIFDSIKLIFKSEEESEEEKIELVENPSTPKEALIKLSDDELWDVRRGVAENPSTPKETLVKLSNDENFGVRLSVLRNPNTPKEALVKLSEDEEKYVREKAIDILKKIQKKK